MLTAPAGLMIYVATRPVDFRKGADGLALLAKETLGHDPMKGVAVVFRAKRADRVKIVVWDGSGLGARDLLMPYGDVVMVLPIVLRIKRTLEAAEIDKITWDVEARKALAA